MKLISQLWAEFEKTVIPPGAPRMQRREMQKAFYAGVLALLGELQQIPDDLNEDQGVAMLEGYQAEAIGFLESLKAIRQPLD
jgi:hypothetical protein